MGGSGGGAGSISVHFPPMRHVPLVFPPTSQGSECMMGTRFHHDCIVRPTEGVQREVPEHFDRLAYKMAMLIAMLIAFLNAC